MTESPGSIGSADERIGAHLRGLREAALLRQEDLATAVPGLGWGRATVEAIERGRRSLKAYELLALVHTMGWDAAGFPVDAVYEDVKSATDRAKRARAESRAAETLGVSLDELDELSRRTWGRTFTDERERRRIDLTARRQTLGHVVRQMIGELEAMRAAAPAPVPRRPLRARPPRA